MSKSPKAKQNSVSRFFDKLFSGTDKDEKKTKSTKTKGSPQQQAADDPFLRATRESASSMPPVNQSSRLQQMGEQEVAQSFHKKNYGQSSQLVQQNPIEESKSSPQQQQEQNSQAISLLDLADSHHIQSGTETTKPSYRYTDGGIGAQRSEQSANPFETSGPPQRTKTLKRPGQQSLGGGVFGGSDPKKNHQQMHTTVTSQSMLKVKQQQNRHTLNQLLTSRSRVVFTAKERETIRRIVHDRNFVMPTSGKATYRRTLWLKCSGALIQIKNNQGYYEKLKGLQQVYPGGSFHQIEIDLQRTYTNIAANSPEMIAKIEPLRNVLCTFVKRNTRIGYLQGMNFLVARLLEVADEEESFWMLCQLTESLVPMDYYSNLLGVLIDLKVLRVLLERKRPRLLAHLEAADPPFTINLLAFQWFVTLFVHHANLPIETEYTVWDLFFIQGDTVIFSAALTLILLLEPEIMKVSRFEEMYQVCNNFGSNVDPKTFLTHYVGQFSNTEIEALRQKFRVEEVINIKESQAQPVATKCMNPRLKFIGNFYSYTNLGAYYKEQAKLQSASEVVKRLAHISSQPLTEIESNLMLIYNCNPDWPVCIFDFTFKNRNPNFLTFKVKRGLSDYIIPNYFQATAEPQLDKVLDNTVLDLEPLQYPPLYNMVGFDPENECELIMVHNPHLCTSHPDFVESFKYRYRVSDKTLLENNSFDFEIDDDLDCQHKADQFVRQIIEPMSAVQYEQLALKLSEEQAFLHALGNQQPSKPNQQGSKTQRRSSATEEDFQERSQSSSTDKQKSTGDNFLEDLMLAGETQLAQLVGHGELSFDESDEVEPRNPWGGQQEETGVAGYVRMTLLDMSMSLEKGRRNTRRRGTGEHDQNEQNSSRLQENPEQINTKEEPVPFSIVEEMGDLDEVLEIELEDPANYDLNSDQAHPASLPEEEPGSSALLSLSGAIPTETSPQPGQDLEGVTVGCTSEFTGSQKGFQPV